MAFGVMIYPSRMSSFIDQRDSFRIISVNVIRRHIISLTCPLQLIKRFFLGLVRSIALGGLSHPSDSFTSTQRTVFISFVRSDVIRRNDSSVPLEFVLSMAFGGMNHPTSLSFAINRTHHYANRRHE